MGGYALTLIDALDSFVLLGDKKGFDDAVRIVIKTVNFDIDARVQVFEVTIRVMGGLVICFLYTQTFQLLIRVAQSAICASLCLFSEAWLFSSLVLR